MKRTLEKVYQEAINSNEGIHIDDSVIFLGHKISKMKDGSIRIVRTNAKIHAGYRESPKEDIQNFQLRGWINGAKAIYLQKYESMEAMEDERVSNFAKSKLNKYYERFSKVK